MSVFTTVTPAQLEVWLKHYDLGALNALTGIAAGIENTNYFVDTARGRYVLTLFEKLSARELPYYLNLMAHLAQHGVPCPAPIANRGGGYLGELNGKPASLVTRLAGKDIVNPTPADCAKVGDVLARLHVAGQSYGMHMDNPRGPAWWTGAMPMLLPHLNAQDAAMLRNEVERPVERDMQSLPHGAIHADLFRDNILFDHGAVAGVIDFYFACHGALLYDVAITVNDWCFQPDGRLDPLRTGALLNGYNAARPFTAAEHGAWTAMLRLAALRFWVSRLYDFHLPRPGELTHAKDPGHFQRLLRSHVAHEAELPPLPGNPQSADYNACHSHSAGVNPGKFMLHVRSVTAARGWRWIADGLALFQKSPLMWLMITLGLFVAYKLILFIPIIGVAAILLMPIVLVGLMEGCRALDLGQELKPGYLLSGFTRNTGALAMLGAVYLLGNLLIILIITTLGGEALMQVLKFMSEQKVTPENIHLIREAVSKATFAVVFGWLLSIPLVMACWFSPLLVYLHDLKILHAMGISLKACLQNMMPFLVYGAILFLALMLVTPLSMATRILDLGMWLLAPLVIPSIYVSYKDIFPAPDAKVGQAETA